MRWIVLSYSLPTQASTPRVTLWRRLRRLGAVSPTGSVFILPANDDCVESFQWLSQEIRQAKGEVLVMRVQQFEGLDNRQLVALFNEARQEEYDEIAALLVELAQNIEADDELDDLSKFQGAVQKVQKQLVDLAKIDYFQCPGRTAVVAQLNRIIRQINPMDEAAPVIKRVDKAHYHSSRWVTRPRPHVDRLACAWLIRRYINPKAVIRYSATVHSDEVAFDMEGAEFSHQGNFCTFEVMIRAFSLKEEALYVLAEIVHEIDLADGRYQRPEAVGIDAALRGWLLTSMADEEIEKQGLALIDGLFATLAQVNGVPVG